VIQSGPRRESTAAEDVGHHPASGGGVNGARRFLVVAIVVLGVLSAPALAVAHPLGNFTINTAAGLVVGGTDGERHEAGATRH